MLAKKRGKFRMGRRRRGKAKSALSTKATTRFQQQLRDSPVWAAIVAEHSEEEAGRLLKEIRLDIE